MDQKAIIKKIEKAVKLDKKYRRDIRYKTTMAFLVKKGFLKTNKDFKNYYRAKIFVKDAIWAGKHVEPRILEVLPAAIARLPKQFVNLDNKNMDLDIAVKNLLLKKKEGPIFMGIPFNKYKVWMDLTLADGRTKPENQKKIARTYKLHPNTIENISQLQGRDNISAAKIIEEAVEFFLRKKR